MTNIDFPFRVSPFGTTATTSYHDHVRDMIEQFLMTSPGERVNRPNFGSGLLQLLFSPNSPELAATLKFTAEAGLQQWLGDVIEIRELEVTSEDSTLRVELDYVLIPTQESGTLSLIRSLES